MDGAGVKWLVIGTAAAIAGLVVYKTAGKAAAVAKTLATETLNPASDKNIVNQGVSAAGAAITGDKDFTVGGWLYDAFHADPVATMAAGDAERAKVADQSSAEAARLARQDTGGYGTGSMPETAPEGSAPSWMFGGFSPSP